MEQEIIRRHRTLSVVVPAYNEEMTLDKAAAAIHQVLEEANIPHELIFVDDGSTDGTWSRITLATEHLDCVRGLRFSRNFGKEAAIMAGLTMSKGACTAVMDCDLQHPPEKLLDMYQLWLQGYQVVEGRKRSRGTETASHGLAAKVFYRLISKAAGFDMSDASDFKLLDRTVVDVLIHIPEKQMFFRAMSEWVGFPHGVVLFDVQKREAGQSKWSGPALVKYALSNIASFSSAPMQIVSVLGVIMFLLSCVLGLIALVQKFTGQALGGFTTVILLLLFIGSIIMISLGLIGYYLARIYEEMKGRPRYIISSVCASPQTQEDTAASQEAARPEMPL